MIDRTLGPKLREAAKRSPIVTLTGPRQAGKTTLARTVFEDAEYRSLEDPDQYELAQRDPRGFLASFKGRVILDEVQRTPDLFKFIRLSVLAANRPGRFILIASHNIHMMKRPAASLAGRSAALHLLPLSLGELWGRAPIAIDSLGDGIARRAAPPREGLLEILVRGLYPPIRQAGVPPAEWLEDYCLRFVESDVRGLLGKIDGETFHRFMRLCAARNGQIVNPWSVAADCGITYPTARRWLAMLEGAFIVTLLPPHDRTLRGSAIERPKLYFTDTGLLCHLLRIRDPKDLEGHAMRGPIFESFVISELRKNFENRGESPGLSFLRDTTGREVDLLVESGRRLTAVEIRPDRTTADDEFDGLAWWRKVSRKPRDPAAVIHAGDDSSRREGVVVHPWSVL